MGPWLHMVNQSSDGQNKKRVQPIHKPSYSLTSCWEGGYVEGRGKKAESEVWVVWKTTHD
jgi:hypothetical protein